MTSALGRGIDAALAELDLQGDARQDPRANNEKDWLAKPADNCRHDIEIINNDIRSTEAMIDESRRGETAWKPEEMYPFLEDLNIRLLKRTTELPKIKELERCSAIFTVRWCHSFS